MKVEEIYLKIQSNTKYFIKLMIKQKAPNTSTQRLTIVY